MSGITIDQLSAAISEAVQGYTDDVTTAIENKVDDVAEQVLAEVKSNHPYHDQTGDYSKNFKKTNQDEYGKTRRVIWNKKHYRRVHLLEFGHAKKGGGKVPAFPHLRIAYDKYGARLPNDLKLIIENGG